MSQFIDNGKLQEITGSQNVMYILNDNEDFSLTQYKVMQNYADNGFAKCAKAIYNGKIKLVYFNDTLKPLNSLIGTLNLETILSIISNALKSIIELKKNGFLMCCNVDFSPEKIFVDMSSNSVELIYLPLEVTGIDLNEYEKNLITCISDIVSSCPHIPISVVNRFCTAMLVENNTIEDVYRFIIDSRTKNSNDNIFKKIETEIIQPKLFFKCLEKGHDCEFIIEQDEFVIGKKISAVNGYIGFNSAVSRQHCKITMINGQFFITDMQSANGTYVNEERVIPGEDYEIKDGDVVRLANTIFSVAIKS